jgi:hypothetical protein
MNGGKGLMEKIFLREIIFAKILEVRWEYSSINHIKRFISYNRLFESREISKGSGNALCSTWRVGVMYS